MTTTIEFRTPEETALQLELLLLGTLTSREFPAGPIPAMPVSDPRVLREIRRMADRIHTLSTEGVEGIGVIGAVPASRRALASTWIAASLAGKRPVTLIDADLRSAHLSFDEGVYAQEGLVDVLRYGVRSPRVVAPTQVPGVSLLPVGSGTVDLVGTWASNAFEPLLRELARSGDFLVVNGPGFVDLEEAGPFLDRISSWMLIHEIGSSDPEETLRIRDRIGADKIIGVLVLHPEGAIAEPAEAKENLREVLKPTPVEQSENAELALPARPGRKRTGLFAVAGAAAVAAALLFPRLFSQESNDTMSNLPPEEPWTAEETAAAPKEEPSDGIVEPLTPAPILTPSSDVKPAEKAPGATATPVIRSDVASTGLDRSMVSPPPASPPPASRTPETKTTTGTTTPSSTNPNATAAPTSGGATSKSSAGNSTPAQPAPAKPKSSTGFFGVHVSSMQTEAKAQEEAKRFEAAGYPTVVRRVDLGEKGIWHRVYAGPYEERAAAERASGEMRARGLTDFTLVHRISGKSSSGS